MSGPAPVLIYLSLALLVLTIALVGFVVTRRRGDRGAPPAAPPTVAPPEAPPLDAPPREAPPPVAPPDTPARTEAPPTDAPPTDAPPTDAPPTDAPPTDAPPTDAPRIEARPEQPAPPDTLAPPAEAPAAATEAPPALPETPVVEGLPESPVVEAPVEAPRRGRVRSIGGALKGIFSRGAMSAEDWEDLEEILLRADVGLAATERIVAALRARKKIDDGLAALKEELLSVLGSPDRSLRRKPAGLSVWLVAGVNGAGKTTTIGKVAAMLGAEGAKVVLAAADTFRAAADTQLERWADRTGADIIKHAPGADPAAVVFDGVAAAKARGADVLIVDTAGRLQTKRNLMEELSKIRRVLEREAGEPDEVLLVLDATTGQNGLQQARAFTEAAPVTGCVLTKLDGTAKGGIVIAVQQDLGIPVKLVGLGEGIEDLAAFDPVSFVDDLVSG